MEAEQSPRMALQGMVPSPWWLLSHQQWDMTRSKGTLHQCFDKGGKKHHFIVFLNFFLKNELMLKLKLCTRS